MQNGEKTNINQSGGVQNLG